MAAMMRANPYRAARHASALALGLTLVLAHSAPAAAQDTGSAGHRASGTSGGSLGVGVNTMLTTTGPFGPQLVYDTGVFHIEGILGFESDGTTNFDLGGRFWYHIHSSQAADFSLGGGLGFTSVDPDGDNNDTSDIHIDVGGQIRAFVVPNVALSVSAGLSISSGDDDFVAITGDLLGAAGVTYFF